MPTKVTHRRGEHVRQTVLAAALDEIVERGAVAASIAGVATRSGVHETTIYRRWATRESLFVDALLNHSAHVIPTPDTGSTRDDLLAITTDIARHLSSGTGRATLQLAATLVGDANNEVRQQFWSGRAELLRPVIERGIRRGDLRADLDPLLVLEILVAPLHTRALLTGLPLRGDLPAQLVDLILAGAHSSPSN